MPSKRPALTSPPFDIFDYGYGGVRDFLRDEFPEKFDGTISNPPYGPRGKTAEAFIETSIGASATGSSLFFCLPISIPR